MQKTIKLFSRLRYPHNDAFSWNPARKQRYFNYRRLHVEATAEQGCVNGKFGNNSAQQDFCRPHRLARRCVPLHRSLHQRHTNALSSLAKTGGGYKRYKRVLAHLDLHSSCVCCEPNACVARSSNKL